MTVCENTKRTIEFKLPDYLPVCANVLETDISGDVVFIFPKMEGSRYWTGEEGMFDSHAIDCPFIFNYECRFYMTHIEGILSYIELVWHFWTGFYFSRCWRG